MPDAAILLLAAHLVWLHAPDGGDISINPNEVVSMRGPKADPNASKLMSQGVGCMISTTDGRFVSVKETCREVMRIFVDKEREQQQ